MFSWGKSYTVTEYINLLRTYSGHINLPEVKRKKVFDDIMSLITNKFDGNVTLKWKTELVLRKSIEAEVHQLKNINFFIVK